MRCRWGSGLQLHAAGGKGGWGGFQSTSAQLSVIDTMTQFDVPRRRSPWLTATLVAAMAIGVIGMLVCVGCCTVWGVPAAYGLYRLNQLASYPEKFTSPLDSAVITHLCSVLELGEDDPRCQDDVALSYDFLPSFLERYSPGTPRQQVIDEIGLYQTGCSEWVSMSELSGTSSEGEIQHCLFDFRGDKAYSLSVAFQRGFASYVSEAVVGKACICALCDNGGITLQCNSSEGQIVIPSAEGPP